VFDVGKMINDLDISIFFRRGVMKKILIAAILSRKASSSALAFNEVEK
jgi:hypothetical protein